MTMDSKPFRMRTRMRSIRRSVPVAAIGAAVLVLAACGGSGGGADGHDGHSAKSPSAASPSADGTHNAADVTFAKGMVPHHRQAVEMAGLAPSRAESDEVRKLAAQIKKAQGPEIRTLSGWLESWGEDVPAEGGTDHSAHGAGGMMTDEQMDELRKSSGKAFDAAFLRMMIKHHEGAVAMAKTERADGGHAAARKMARAIIASQSAEIKRMNDQLDKS